MDRGNLGERVRAVRKTRDLSQEALAREAGVSLNLVNKLERGVVTDPHYSTLSGIARALGVSVQALVREPAPAGKAEAPETGPVESRVPIFSEVHGAARAQLLQDSRAAKRAPSSDQVQTHSKRHDVEAKAFLLEHSPDDVAEEYYVLMERLVQEEYKTARLRYENDRLQGANAGLKENLARKDEEIARLREEAGVGP